MFNHEEPHIAGDTRVEWLVMLRNTVMVILLTI